jgi:hypothetical protein
MKINRHFDVIHKYVVPRAHWSDRDWGSSTKEGFEDNFREWCHDNLQDGWSLVKLFGEKWIVNIVDEIDYDLLILKWGK